MDDPGLVDEEHNVEFPGLIEPDRRFVDAGTVSFAEAAVDDKDCTRSRFCSY